MAADDFDAPAPILAPDVTSTGDGKRRAEIGPTPADRRPRATPGHGGGCDRLPRQPPPPRRGKPAQRMVDYRRPTLPAPVEDMRLHASLRADRPRYDRRQAPAGLVARRWWRSVRWPPPGLRLVPRPGRHGDAYEMMTTRCGRWCSVRCRRWRISTCRSGAALAAPLYADLAASRPVDPGRRCRDAARRCDPPPWGGQVLPMCMSRHRSGPRYRVWHLFHPGRRQAGVEWRRFCRHPRGSARGNINLRDAPPLRMT
jgi:hypothetical protein